MNRWIFFLYLVPLFLNTTVGAQKLTFEKTEDGVLVKEGDDPVLFYQTKTKSIDGEYPRANYIHPLYGIDGAVLTEDFPEDHLHHRGIFWAWHQNLIDGKSVGDAWSCENFNWEVGSVMPQAHDNGSLTLKVQTSWKSPLWLDSSGNQKSFLAEESEITIYPKENDYRIIDFEISLLALESAFAIGGSDDEKGYSGFSVRMKLPDDLRFNSVNGPVTPITNQIAAGTWMDMSGSLGNNGTTGGILLIGHPENPGYPEPWILRSKNSMQNVAYPGREPAWVSDTEPMVLRYRMVVYKNVLPEKEILNLQRSFR